MSTTPATQMQRAKQLIQQKRYDDARALLITVDHPKADMRFNRLNKMSSATPTSPATTTTVIHQAPQDKSFTVKLFVSIILLLFWAIPGIIALAIFAPEAKKYPNASGAQALIWLNKFAFGFLIIAGLALVILMVLPILMY